VNWGEFRYSLRMIVKTPGISAVAVLSLALGIGANTAIFSIIDTLLLKRLPVKSPQELYRVTAGEERSSWNYPDYVAFRDHNTSITLAACAGGTQRLGMQLADADSATPAEIVHATVVSGNYFEVLGVGPGLGRVLNVEDDRVPSAAPYAVLSHDYWQSRFGSDPRAVGRKIRLNGYPFTIVGVARRGFHGTDPTAAPDLFVPILMFGEISGEPFLRWNTRHWWWLQVVGRMKPGASTKKAETEIFAIYREQEQAELRAARDPRFVNRAQPIALLPAARGHSYIRMRLEKPLLVLMSVVGLVLLIACANVANLMLVRGAARQREMAVRLAVGATRARLTGQLLVESIIIALIGGIAGLLLSGFGIKALLAFVSPAEWDQGAVSISPDLRLLGFAAAVSLLTGVLSGIAPALRSTRPDIVPALKDEVAGSGGSSRLTLRNTLVVFQVALSILVLIVAGLFVRSLGKLKDIDPGFRPENTLAISIDPTPNGYKGQRLREFYERLRSEVETVPGVRTVSLGAITPLSGMQWNGDFTVEGYQWKPSDVKYIDMNAVSPRFFETMGIPLVLGRDFRDEDNPVYYPDPPDRDVPGEPPAEPPGPRVMIINESMAKQFFEGRNPIALHVALDEKYNPERAYEIVGIVKDSYYFSLRETPKPMLYVPTWRATWPSRTVCIRTTRSTPELVETVRHLATRIDPAVPVTDSRTLQDQIDANILEDRLIASLSGLFGLLALVLAGVGLYGVLSYVVTRRTREIGIRVALGAQRSAVLGLILRDAALLVGVGAVIGIPAALAASRLIKSLLYGVGTQDPAAIAGGTLVLLAVAALAGLVPALRATKVDPMVALRYE
jgi:predicted permease